MILKYTSRLIKSTLNRFLAILAIVFIGVSFMMGLRSNYDIMKQSVEEYADEKNLYDIQLYSNFGFDENDVQAIEKLDYVEEVWASKTRDTYATDEDGNTLVTRLLEADSSQNGLDLTEGRMPISANECVISDSYLAASLNIGDTFTVYFKDADILETVETDKYVIVGKVRSIENMCKTYTTSLLDNNQLSLVAYIPNDTFISEYYTCIYIKLVGSADYDSFSEDYYDFVNEKIELLEDFSINQSQELRNKIIAQATEQLEAGKAELEENRAKYQAELDEAKAKLDAAKKQLDDAYQQIQDGEAAIPQAEKEIADGQAEVDAGYAELKTNEEKLAAAEAEISKYGEPSEVLNTITNLYQTYKNAQNSINNLNQQKAELEAKKASSQAIIDASGYSSAAQVRSAMSSMDKESEEYSQALQVYSAFVTVDSVNTQEKLIDTRISATQTTLDTVESAFQNQFGMNVEEGYTYLSSSINQMLEGRAQIQEGYAQLAEAENKLTNGRQQLADSKVQLEQGKIDYEEGLVEYNQGLADYEAGVEEFNKQMSDAQDQIEDGEKQLAELQEVQWHVLNRYDTNYAFYMYRNTCEQMKSIGTIIPLLFFAVAAFVCLTTMTRLIDEQRGQIGTYRAIGFRKGEVISIYMLYVAIASLAASIVAIFVGVNLFPNIIYSTWNLMYDLPSIVVLYPVDNIILCISCFTILMMAVTYFVIRSSLKETTAQLLRPKAPKNTKETLIEKWTWLWNKLNFTSKVTMRNILRYKARFIMTVVGVAGCTSLLVMGFGIKDSVKSVVELQFHDIYKYDYSIELKNDRHIDEMIAELKADKNVEAYVEKCVYSTSLTLADEEVSIDVAIMDGKKAELTNKFVDYKSEEKLSLGNDGVIITDKFCKINNLSVGDEIEILSYNGVAKKVKIAGIMQNYVMSCIYMSDSYYQKVFNEEIEYTKIDVVCDGDASKLLAMADDYNDIAVISDINSQTSTFNDMFEALNLIIIVIILVAGALAFVVLINLTNVNISERIREIATLKVLGFRRKEVNSYIFKEVLLMSIVGTLIGLPLGKLEEQVTMGIIDMEMVSFPSVIQPLSYLYAVGITLCFTIIVLFITKKTLNNVEMVESLKSIE